MATEVLRPHDCLIRSQRRSIHGGGVIVNSRISNRRNKPVPAVGQPELIKSSPVTILRRGESLDRKMVLKSKVGGGDVYAGSAFLSTSPPPASSLPLPSFSNRKVVVVVDDSATRDLRQLLRLE